MTAAADIVRPLLALSVEKGEWPDEAKLEILAERAVAASLKIAPEEVEPDTEISILFTDDEAMQALNYAWRGKDKPTNVLSFPQPSGPLLGDIVLASETVRREAALAEKLLEDHIAHLIVHGVFHLLGYDHEEDGEAEEMESLESAALSEMGIADPYTASQKDQ